jgi:hypothetical protein
MYVFFYIKFVPNVYSYVTAKVSIKFLEVTIQAKCTKFNSLICSIFSKTVIYI